MSIEATGEIPSYSELQKGHHPDISASAAAKLTKEARRRLAIHLTLRDLFTPLADTLSQAVMNLNPEDIGNIRDSFTIKPAAHPYARSYGELVTQLKKAQSDYGIEHYYNEGRPGRDLYSERVAYSLSYTLNLMKINTNPSKIDYGRVIESAPGKFKKFYFAPTELERPQRWETIITPVGEYGHETAIKFVEAGRILMRLADSLLAKNAYQLTSEYNSTLGESTARGRDFVDNDGFSEERDRYYPLLTLEEGIESLLGALAFLLPEKIAGIDDADQAVTQVINNRLPNEIAAQIPMGYLIPKIRAGRFLPGIITLRNNVPQISQPAKDHMNEAMKYSQSGLIPQPKTEKTAEIIELEEDIDTYLAELTQEYIPHFEPEETQPLPLPYGLACPLARKSNVFKESGIEQLSQAFLHVYKAL